MYCVTNNSIKKVSVPENWYKIKSYSDIRELDCPVLNSLVIQDKSDITQDSVGLIKSILKNDRCTVRFQSINPNKSFISGGNSMKITYENLMNIWSTNHILWILEPTDRFSNLYGINIQYNRSKERITYEIVGEGFDVSDLNRGDIDPHQTIEINPEHNRGLYNNIWYQSKVNIMNDLQYKKTIDIRIKKVKPLLKDREKEFVIPQKFVPLQLSQLERLDKYSQLIFEKYWNEDIINISASIFKDNRIVFWDVQKPIEKLQSYMKINEAFSSNYLLKNIKGF